LPFSDKRKGPYALDDHEQRQVWHSTGNAALENLLRPNDMAFYDAEWTDCLRATPLGGMAYFGHFLHANGVFDEWVSGCPKAEQSSDSARRAGTAAPRAIHIFSPFAPAAELFDPAAQGRRGRRVHSYHHAPSTFPPSRPCALAPSR